ncbi:MAG TPA: sigma-54 dependent transcriptional regulator [Thermoanaerobaculia bacterium]|nr:sigma-54 dependent transcriptional regulator [Thermoanaerobaculia bacterium]
MARNNILLVDDEPAIRFGMRKFLQANGFEVQEAGTLEAALQVFQAGPPDAVVLDYVLPDGNALDLLPRLREADAEVPVVVVTAHGSIDLAVRAIKEGAENFLTKPVELATLLVLLQRVLDGRRTRQRQLAGDSRRGRRRLDPFLGTSAAIRELARGAARVAAVESPVLVQGETGTGKGVLAAWLHEQGPRAEEAFVDLNCAGLSRDFLETELFGHEKGAFTGAAAAKPGLLEVAHRGTVFLDEIGDVDPLVQPKLLKVLEEHRFRRMGAVRDRVVDIRLIAATHHDLARRVQEKSFRGDLYFRVSTLPLVVPPLRERPEDVPLLARALLAILAADCGGGERRLTPAAERALARYRWPGNIRELRNVLERALLLADGAEIDVADLRFDPLAAAGDGEGEGSDLSLEELERRHIERVLRRERRNVARAAEVLGVPKSSLYQKLKRFGIELSEL